MIALLLGLLFLQPLTPQPITTFTLECYTVSGRFATVQMGYTSNAVRHFAGEGADFVVQVGAYPAALAVTIIANQDREVLSFREVRVVNNTDSIDRMDLIEGAAVEVPIDLRTLPDCAPLPCPATAIDGATGQAYCYTPTESGVIPLPPAYQ